MFRRVLIANRGEVAVQDRARLPRAGDRGGRRLLDRRPRLAARHARRPGRPHRPAAGRAELPQHALAGRRGHDDRLRRRASRLGLPRGERRVRGRVRGQRPRLRRPAPRVDRGHGGQDSREGGGRGGGRPARARARTARRPWSRPAPLAGEIGFPLLLKAAAGRRRARDAARRRLGGARVRLPHGLGRGEARFSDGSLYVERAIVGARHVEIQVLGDGEGRVLTLGERDCSIQRRHQKLVEEGPSPAVTAELRADDGGRRPAGDRGPPLPGRRDDRVPARRRGPLLLHRDEHAPPGRAPGDRAAHRRRPRAGRSCESPPAKASRTTGRAELRGHAIELRINAEDPAHDFMPAPGTVTRFRPAAGPGRPRRHARRRGLRDPAVLRLPGRQGDRLGRGPACGAPPRACGR